MEIINIKIKDLKPYEKNAKKHDKTQIDNVAESIKQFGMVQPIVVDKDNVVIIGHCRLEACKKLKFKEVPCVRTEDLDEEQVAKLRLLDNKLNVSDWDFDLLGEELLELDLSDFELDWGLPELVEEEKPKELVEDEVKTDNIPKRTEKGDIWKLGNHYLGCGDSTDFLWLKTLMQGKKADLVFTDPPYGVGFENVGVTNDNQNENDLIEFNKQWINVMFDYIKDNGSFYIWGTERSLMNIYAFILYEKEQKDQIVMRSLITWDKGVGQYQNAEHMRRYPVASEKCLFYMCGVQGFNNNAENYFENYEPIRKYLEIEANKARIDAKKIKEICGVGMFSHWFTKSQWDLMREEYYKKIQNYCIENKINAFCIEYEEIKKQYEEIKKQYEEIKKQWYDTRAYFDNTHDNMNDVWHFNSTNGEERESAGGHATPKPIALCGRAIKSSSRENEIVLDVFGGSGSTLIACEQLNRICYCNELEPHWCDVIINRWEQFTGKKAEKLN